MVAGADAVAESGLARLEVVEDRGRRRRADPGDAQGHHLDQRVERSDAAGRLDPDVRRDGAAHEREILVGGAGRREPGGGLDEVAAGCLGQVAGSDLLVVGQVGVLEDDLDDGAGSMRDVDHGPDVRLDVGVAPGLEGADLDDHVELARAVADRPDGLEDLGHGQVVAVREADRRADRDGRPVQDLPGPDDIGGPHADGRDVIGQRQPAAGLHEGVVELRPEQRVVDRLGDVAVGQGVDREGRLGHVALT